MKSSQSVRIAFLAILSFYYMHAGGQARSSAGFGIGPNLPIGSGYPVGTTGALQISAKLSNKVALTPLIGVTSIKGQREARYNGYYYVESSQNVALLMTSLPVRYYITKGLFTTLAPSLYVGGEDASSSGIGGTAGVGYDLALDPVNSLEFMLHCDAVPVYENEVGVIGLRILYKINFHRGR
ncbi:hypothetical protein F0L74_31540 [Chitinophaga agrisoli]|uniref:Outer membrane protein with beta-barrel domain n=1 Tax=Chitinophaga agrisoli TaxID=2607653 RepID=A0A5B2VRB1_9BACT|nr:hypothetical protein [Chitinophaga agrisoli]KAA2240679.1 hypothetical protein F0L74_31540 [Chitinophaga agrisoli]